MIPLIIGAAAAGLAGVALLGDDKKIPANGQNSSTENSDMYGRKFTILGETGSGKTCYLLGMYYEMSMSVAGYTVVATDPDADKSLTLRYERLKDKSRGQTRFPDGTDQVEKLNFNLQYDYETILPFTWVDYPGGFLDATRRDVASEQYKEVEQVEQSIKESEMLFICIDGENLVGNSTRNKIRKVKTRCAKHINPYLTELRNKFKDAGGLPPIGMLITKHDMCKDDTDNDETSYGRNFASATQSKPEVGRKKFNAADNRRSRDSGDNFFYDELKSAYTPPAIEPLKKAINTLATNVAASYHKMAEETDG